VRARSTFLLVFAVLLSFPPLAWTAEQLPPATAAYNSKLTKVVKKAVNSAISKHKEQFYGLSLKIHYAVDRDGGVHNVRVATKPFSRSAEKTITDALEAAKLPAIPIEVQLEVGAGYLEGEAELTMKDEATIAREEAPSAYEYNLRVHKILQNDVAPNFGGPRHLEVDYEFYLDPNGRVTSMKVHAKSGGEQAEQIVARSIRRIKCPQVPPQAFKELDQKPPFKIYGTLTWDPNG
jgi:hypothetical protein